ncbi:MAG: adenylyltransferase/cytidyltransferase family protein [Euryarchaeota archaeon]
MMRAIVLGRFQPLHNGHAYLIAQAAAAFPDDPVMIAVGSAQSEWEPNNPWSAADRTAMVVAWAESTGHNVEVCTIEDINDPPNWVEHARKHHGEGILVTSDEATSTLYNDANFPVHTIDLSEREKHEGWRVRQTAKMLSTVYDDEAVREVLSSTVPHAVIEWLIKNDALYRLSTFETGVHAG